jgi:putative sterol carrier protein
MMKMIQVHCYSGHTYAERPRSFLWQGTEYKVEEIEKAWQEPGKKLFKVITEQGKLFELCYSETEDRWSATELAT